MKKRKWFCLLLSVALLLTGCGGKGSSDAETNMGSGVPEGGRYDYEITDEMAALPLQSGETIIGVQYLNGERIWFLKDSASEFLCYHENSGERELLLESVPRVFTGCKLYTDGEYFYAYQINRLTVLNAEGEEKYTLYPEEGILRSLCESREGSIVLAFDTEQGGLLKTLDVESGTLSGGSRLPDCTGLGTGLERGLLVIDDTGAYDLDIESGEKTWYMKWNGTSYIPTYERYWAAASMGEDGTLEQIEYDDDGNYYLLGLRKINPEEMGKTPLVFRVNYASVELKLMVAKFNRENKEYHVFLEDRGEEAYQDFQTRNDMEIATGNGPDLIAANAVTDMQVLAEKGALENLEPYLAQAGTNREDYYQGTFESRGMAEGVYSVGWAMHINNLYIREEFLSSDGQNDVKTLLDNLESYEKPAIFSKWMSSVSLMSYFFQMSDNFYGMVDWEGKTCDFSGELWEQILRVSERYGRTERNRELEAIAEGGDIWSFSWLVMIEENLGSQGMVMVGYPSEEGMVNLLLMESVAINADSAHKDGAWQFIRFLLEEETQKMVLRRLNDDVDLGTHMPVYEKVLEEDVREYLQNYLTEEHTDRGYIIRPELPEGIEEQFWENITNAKHASYRTEQVLAIIEEEAELYFTGDKTIEEISAVIENRVKLYLAEME